jgi:hypothetical protein
MGGKNYVPCYSVVGKFRWVLFDATKSNRYFEAIDCSLQMKRVPVPVAEANKQTEDSHLQQCDPAYSGRN